MFRFAIGRTSFALLMALCATSGALAAEDDPNFLGLDLDGSLGEGLHDRYVPSATNFVFNETPYITTEVKLIYAYHNLSDDFVTGGGNANVVAVQARIAITERLGFIATKDGYTWLNFDRVLPDTDGFNNITAGLKYNFISIPESKSLVTAGLRYEIPVNDLDTGGIELMGDGDGFLNPFITAATMFRDFGLQGSFGVNFALDPDVDNSFVHYSVHADYELFPGFFPIVELNGFTAFNQANRITGALGDLDGADFLNFGSDDRSTTVTGAIGLRYRITENVLLGLAGQTELTNHDNSIFGSRITTDMVVHF